MQQLYFILMRDWTFSREHSQTGRLGTEGAQGLTPSLLSCTLVCSLLTLKIWQATTVHAELPGQKVCMKAVSHS